MSCGGSGDPGMTPATSDDEWAETDCAKALQRLEFFIDNELENADLQQIKQHIEDCAPCLATHDLERVVKALVARSCTEHAPEELRQRVMVRIRQVSVTLTEQQPG
jgi:mycothiol system anti-sigma-R factor